MKLRHFWTKHSRSAFGLCPHVAAVHPGARVWRPENRMRAVAETPSPHPEASHIREHLCHSEVLKDVTASLMAVFRGHER